MRTRIATVFVLANPEVKTVVGHERLDAAIAGRAPVVQRQLAFHDVRNEVGFAHGQAAHGIGFHLITGLVKIVGAIETIAKHKGVVEHRLGALKHVEHVGGCGASQEQGAAGRGIHDAVPRIDGNGEHGAGLPLKHVLLGVTFLPNLGGAAAFHHQVNFFKHVLFGMQCAGTRHLHHVAAPFGFCAVQLNEMALATRALPRHQGQVLHFVNAHIAKHWQAFGFHVGVIGRGLFFENAVAGLFVAGRLVPVAGVFIVWHAAGPLEVS